MLRLRKYITGFSGICGGPFYRIVCHVKVSLTGLQPTVAVSSLCCPTSVFVLHIVSVCVCVCVYAQSCPTLCDPMDCSLPSSSVHGIPRQEYWSGLSFPSPGHRPDPGIGFVTSVY